MADSGGQALRARFDELADEWAQETRLQSSSTEIEIHPAYQRIIGMGPVALPFILDRLSSADRALVLGTGRHLRRGSRRSRRTPVRVEAMAEAWLRWGRAKGLIPAQCRNRLKKSLSAPSPGSRACPGR